MSKRILRPASTPFLAVLGPDEFFDPTGRFEMASPKTSSDPHLLMPSDPGIVPEISVRSLDGSLYEPKTPKKPFRGKVLSGFGKSLSLNDKGLSLWEAWWKGFVGAPGEIRTPNPLIRSQTVCPYQTLPIARY